MKLNYTMNLFKLTATVDDDSVFVHETTKLNEKKKQSNHTNTNKFIRKLN